MDIYLVDGNSYIYRAFHAIKGLTNSKGFPTNAIYGFTNTLMKIIREKKPDVLCIAFDSKGPTERHLIYEEYKAQRPKAPSELSMQVPYIKQIVHAFHFPVFEIPGYEADDIIGTFAKQAASQGANVFIVSGDKDMMQIVRDGVKIYDPMKDAIISEEQVKERFGVEPEKVPDVMAITGDSIDNIPGVKGLGEKRAKELLDEAGSLDELLAHPEKIKNERYRKMVEGNIEIIKVSRTLATINFDVPVKIDIRQLDMHEPDWDTLLTLFTGFEFKSLIKLIPSKESAQRGAYAAITTQPELFDFLGIPQEHAR